MTSYSTAAGLLAAAVLGLSAVDARLAPDISPFAEMAYDDFKPLACNGVMNNGTFDGCVPWSGQNYDLVNNPVTIECGTCVTMDVADAPLLHFQQGLDVQGALIFPNNWKGTIKAPYVFVQGHLRIENDAVVEAGNIDGLTFILEGTADQPFFPNAQNSASCREDSCDVGKKPFVVAGGQLHINALPDTCPTWVPLLDVVKNDAAVTATDYPKPPTPATDCTSDIINHDFVNGYGPFKAGLGSEERVLQTTDNGHTSPSFRVENRKKDWQGPFVDFVTSGLRDCVVANQTYLIHAKAKVTVEDPDAKQAETNSTYSNCHRDGSDCLALTLHTANAVADDKPKLAWRTVGQVESSQKHDDGEWFDFVAEFAFTDTDLSEESLYVMLYFGGPETGVAVELADVKMTLPGADLFPDPSAGSVCNNLVVNGDAENAPPHKFPWAYIGNPGSSVTVKNENVNGTSNNYFAIRGRDATWASVNVELINDCIVRYSQYTIKSRIRLHSSEEQNVRMILKTWPLEKPASPPYYTTKSVGFGGIDSCVGLSAATGWFECSRTFQFGEEHETATRIELSFVVPEDKTSDIDIDDIMVERYAPPLNELIVEDSVAECWGANATILQTSHTLSFKDENVLTIESVTKNDDGTATIKTTTPIAKPSTAKDDPNYAVEIALLDRNVKIMPVEPHDDSVNPLHGAHFMIAHTPDVPQILKGVHMSKMGQQGNFGRYPVHLHMNKNIEGSEISKNLVRGSNQRCYVVHATHNVTLEYNIAHDTFGHCFMLEDGIEQNNTFNYNLGAHTKETPDEGILSIAESDMFCSTFWISNPRNYFKGNVAAGSEDTGFWYEMLELVRGPSVKLDPDYDVNPSSSLFGHFKENRFHSNKGEGFKLYPNGYFPETRAIFEDTISVKNKGDGVLFHNSKNLGLNGGFYGDNRMQIEVDKQSDDVTVTNARVVGFSELYQREAEAGGLASHCPAHRPLSGVQLHSFLRFRDSKGYHLENITFSNFEEGGFCIGTTAIEMDKQLRDGHFDAFTSLKNMMFTEGAPSKEKFNMCALSEEEMFIGDLAINDLDGSLHPDEASSTPGFVVSDTPMMTQFLAEGACKEMEGSCSLYCESACYRTVNLAVPVAFAFDDMVLEVTSTATGETASFPGYFENKTKVVQNVDVEDTYENYVYQRRRYYSPIVPMGEYTMTFKKDNAAFWPQMAELVWEDPPNCEPFIDENTTTFIVPSPTEAECANLVRNPGGEDGSHNYWMHSGGGIKVHNEGSAGSYAISSEGRTGAWQGPGQFLDTRCFTEGQQYEVTAKFKLIEPKSGATIDCDPNQKNVNAFDVCPRVSFRMRKLLGNKIGDGVEINYAYPMGEAVGPFKSGEWNNIYGVFTVTETMAAADAVFMFIERARPGIEIVVDEVMIQTTTQSCANAIYNGDFESGDTRFWSTIGQSKIDMYTPGHANSSFALRTTERQQFWSSMAHEINLDCVQEGESYALSGMMKLLDENDNAYDCDTSLVWGVDGMDNVCPVVGLRVVSGNNTVDEIVGTVTGTWKSGDWNAFNGKFTATPDLKKADTVTLYFTRFRAGKHIVLDDITMSPIAAQDTDQLVNNGDGSAGDTRYFNIKDGGTIGVTQPGKDGADDYAFIVSGRTSATCGLQQTVDNTYLETGIMYKISADLKLFYKGGVTPYDCDPSANYGDKKCPVVSLRSKNAMEPPTQRPVATVTGEWATGEWNTIEGFITFFANEIQSGSLVYYIDGAAADVVMVLDNIKLLKTNVNPGELTGTGNATASV